MTPDYINSSTKLNALPSILARSDDKTSCYNHEEMLDFPFRPGISYVVVHNLPQDALASDLQKLLNSFDGTVCVDMIHDKEDTRVGILTLKDSVSAKNLVESYRHFSLDGNELELIEFSVDAEPDSYRFSDQSNETESERSTSSNDSFNRVLYIGNIPLSYEKSELMRLLSGFGKISSFEVVESKGISSNPNNFLHGFITFENVSSADALFRKANIRQIKYFYREHELVIKKGSEKPPATDSSKAGTGNNTSRDNDGKILDFPFQPGIPYVVVRNLPQNIWPSDRTPGS